MLPFLLLLLAASWAVGAALVWRPAAALATLVFLASTPVILGHAAVVALDVPVTAMTMLSAVPAAALVRVAGRGARACASVCAAGLAVATKMSAVPFIGVRCLTLIALRLMFDAARSRCRGMAPRRIGSAALALLLALLVMIGVYGPER